MLHVSHSEKLQLNHSSQIYNQIISSFLTKLFIKNINDQRKKNHLKFLYSRLIGWYLSLPFLAHTFNPLPHYPLRVAFQLKNKKEKNTPQAPLPRSLSERINKS